jgi:hypothetical protein
MTEQGLCETCKNLVKGPTWYGHFYECRRLSVERDRMINLAGGALPSALIPADFGCIYHEPKPVRIEPICDTCAYWDRTTVPCMGFRFRCKPRSTEDFVTMTGGRTTCELWSKKHG